MFSEGHGSKKQAELHHQQKARCRALKSLYQILRGAQCSTHLMYCRKYKHSSLSSYTRTECLNTRAPALDKDTSIRHQEGDCSPVGEMMKVDMQQKARDVTLFANFNDRLFLQSTKPSVKFQSRVPFMNFI